jgi:hypothetical protein
MVLLRRYLSGLAVATLGLCAAGWLALVPAAFGYRGTGPDRAALTDRATAGGLAVVSLVTLVCAILTWRRRLRADGILRPRKTWASRRRARDTPAEPVPDPVRVLSDLRVLLASVMAESADGAPDARGSAAVTVPAPRNEPEPEAHAGPEAGPQAEPGQPEPGTQDEPEGHGEPDTYEDVAAPGEHRPEKGPSQPQLPPPEPQPAPEPEPIPMPEPRQVGLAAMESMLVGAELLMVGCGEEEAW